MPCVPAHRGHPCGLCRPFVQALNPVLRAGRNQRVSKKVHVGWGAEGKVNEENISGALRKRNKKKKQPRKHIPSGHTFNQVISLWRKNTICTRVSSQKNRSQYVPSACALKHAHCASGDFTMSEPSPLNARHFTAGL